MNILTLEILIACRISQLPKLVLTDCFGYFGLFAFFFQEKLPQFTVFVMFTMVLIVFMMLGTFFNSSTPASIWFATKYPSQIPQFDHMALEKLHESIFFIDIIYEVDVVFSEDMVEPLEFDFYLSDLKTHFYFS